MPFPVSAINAHVALNVRNVDASVSFYRRLFGIEPAKTRTGYAKFDLNNPPLNLSLNEMPSLSDTGASHTWGFKLHPLKTFSHSPTVERGGTRDA